MSHRVQPCMLVGVSSQVDVPIEHSDGLRDKQQLCFTRFAHTDLSSCHESVSEQYSEGHEVTVEEFLLGPR